MYKGCSSCTVAWSRPSCLRVCMPFDVEGRGGFGHCRRWFQIHTHPHLQTSLVILLAACSTDANKNSCHAVHVESWPSRGFVGNLSRQGSSSFWLCSGPSQGALQSTSRAARHQSATLHVHQVCFALPHVRIKAMRSLRCGPQTSLGPCAKRHETRDAASGYEAGLGASVPCCLPEDRGRGSRPNETPSPCAPKTGSATETRGTRCCTGHEYSGQFQPCNAKAVRRARKDCGSNSFDAQ